MAATIEMSMRRNMHTKDFKFVPLLILIPVIAVIFALFLFDEPETVEDVLDNDQSIELTLIVGQAGTIDNDIGEPIYASPDVASQQIATLQYNCCVFPSNEQEYEDWIYVDLPGKETNGYVLKNNVKAENITIRDNSAVRMKIIQDALSYIGLRFIRYGDSLEDGVDCSNFINKIYSMNGVEVPTKPNDIKASGMIVPEESARPGDIVYYDANNGGGHVGIYLGNGYQLNSTGHSGRTYPEGGVRICSLQYRDRLEYEFVNVIGD